VVELGGIRSLLASGSIVVACGGGGIPATRRGEHLAGIDAVIDKDRASSLLARELGADRLVILTEVPAVYSGFGTDGQQELRELTAGDAAALAPELAAGSMRPKLEASVEFVRATGHEALITSPAALGDALAGRTGTRIKP
jgi:carbamate kinase